VPAQILTYPSIALNGAGKGAVGASWSAHIYPSASFLPFNAAGPSGAVVVAVGAGPNDGFTATFDGGYRTRWATTAGDRRTGGTVGSPRSTSTNVRRRDVQRRSTCGFTRTFYANWSRLYGSVRSPNLEPIDGGPPRGGVRLYEA
jgi:hypothetical protein